MENKYIQDKEISVEIAKAVSAYGGTAYYVGGCVRDALLGIENKDIDIEVHGITPEQLEEILDSIGERISIGSSFGVYNLKGYSVDIAMPRKETSRGSGHKDFNIFVDPFIGTEKASLRRDFTINALMQNVLTGEITDHYNGINDLNNKIIRHINDTTFTEDPLRVLRAAQFAARFNFDVAEETISLCSGMILNALSKERIEGELKKALLKAEKPSKFFENLRKMNQLQYWFKEVADLINVPQNPQFHAEGDVWTHTMMVLDEAAKHRDKINNPLGFMLTALCHDFGKAVCTETLEGRIRSIEHETKGLPIIETFLRRITSETKLINYVLNLSELHMKPNAMASAGASVKSTNKLFDKAIDPLGLVYMAISDNYGRIMPSGIVPHEDFLFKRLDTYIRIMSQPFVQGKDLLEAGLIPGPNFSEYLEYAHKLRLVGIDKENTLKQTLAYARKKKDIVL